VKVERGSLAKAEARHREAAYKADAEDKRAADAKASKDALAPPGEPPSEKRAKALAEQADAVRRDLEGLRAGQAKGGQTLATLTAQIAAMEREAARLGVGDCPTCGQAIPEKLVKDCRATLDRAKEQAAEAEKRLGAEREDVADQVAELEEQHTFLVKQSTEVAAALRAYERAKGEGARLDDVIAKAAMAGTRYASERSAAATDMRRHERELSVLRASERVVGLKGVRAHMLGSLLGGLEQITNGWLAPLGMSVGLKPFRELANKKVEDAIDLTVDGAGGGFGYDACSNGERRRIDIFLLLALASVSQAAHGRGQGTLFFDEAFDGLDADGQEAIASALTDIARDRCVVLISHSESLLAAVDARLRIHVEAGEVYEL
jgi:DNA repair exonuclease SbcCD ATPase subunit